ncbi:MAG: SH3 domain-containing protein [Acidimicrobiales bacterium]
MAPFLLFLVVTLGWFLFLFRRRHRPDGGAPSLGAATLVAVGADGGPMFAVAAPARAPIAVSAKMNAAATVASAPKAGAKSSGKPARSGRTKRVTAASAAAGAEAAVAMDVATLDPAADASTPVVPAPPDGAVDVAQATSWEVSDDAPLAATSAAYAATRAAAAGPPAARTFAKPPPKGVQRATIKSRLVRLNSEPDDIRSAELGRLDRGDEVEIVDSFEGYLSVRVPDGTTGWIHRATIV